MHPDNCTHCCHSHQTRKAYILKHSIIASILLFANLPACGSTSDGTNTSDGGILSGTGGGTSSAGYTSSAGTTHVGGMVSTGGTKATTTGGTVGTGGVSTVGTSAVTTGGVAGIGGNMNTGGTAGVGGNTTGGTVAMSTGGTAGVGGNNTGGTVAMSAGGTVGVGGNNTGGTVTMTTGGIVGIGGSNTGGTTSTNPTTTCTNSAYPVSCPALGAVPAGCWSSGVACSTIRTCSDGNSHACSSANQIYDCTAAKCVCGPDSAYPLSCPAIGTFPDTCWPSGVVCSTITSCSGSLAACDSASLQVSCVTGTCI
jgi:hypothetical protein